MTEQVTLWAAGAQSCWGTLGDCVQHATQVSPQHVGWGTQAAYPRTADGHGWELPLECQFLQHVQHTLGKAVGKYAWAWRGLRHSIVIYCYVTNHHKLSNLKQHIYHLTVSIGQELSLSMAWLGPLLQSLSQGRNQGGSLGWGLSWRFGWGRIRPDVTLSSLIHRFS